MQYIDNWLDVSNFFVKINKKKRYADVAHLWNTIICV